MKVPAGMQRNDEVLVLLARVCSLIRGAYSDTEDHKSTLLTMAVCEINNYCPESIDDDDFNSSVCKDALIVIHQAAEDVCAAGYLHRVPEWVEKCKP